MRWIQHCHESKGRVACCIQRVIYPGYLCNNIIMLVFAYYYLAILYYLNYHDKDGHLETFTFYKLNPKPVAISGNLQLEKRFSALNLS